MNILKRIKAVIKEIWISFKGESWEYKYSTTPLKEELKKGAECTCGHNGPPSIDHGTKCARYDPRWIVPKNRIDP